MCAYYLYSDVDQDAVVEEKSRAAQLDENQTVPSCQIRSNVHHDHKASILELHRASTFVAESPGLANIAIPLALILILVPILKFILLKPYLPSPS